MQKFLKLAKKKLNTKDAVVGAGETKEAAYKDASKKLPNGTNPENYKMLERLDDTFDGFFVSAIGYTPKRKKKTKPPVAHTDMIQYDAPFRKI